ncbi:embryonic polarity protein dorsal-like [Uranotaenia lowii]|uniref:embryonic polarity protein dorsal-like n=1 Tax=Uranotaenia lowii TaxID=190385 RepID=UPI002479C834|nr:embryonic polarity protein dorsal-like [Uranotaenia lowii]
MESIWVEITEQPQQNATRYRYKCEGKCAGSIPGVNNTEHRKSFPTIKVHGFTGKATVTVSCVMASYPHRVHPHGVVGKNCKQGIYKAVIEDCRMSVAFSNLGIRCIRRKAIPEALLKRQQLGVDPYGGGYNHADSITNKDLSSIRLCFEVVLETKNGFTHRLQPVVSDVIYDKKTLDKLVICELSRFSSPVRGGKLIIMTCEKISKTDIGIRFFEQSADGRQIWQDFGIFQPTNVHKKLAIAFRTPPYAHAGITKPVKVQVQLFRPSDGLESKAVSFEYYPNRTYTNSPNDQVTFLPDLKEICEDLPSLDQYLAIKTDAVQSMDTSSFDDGIPNESTLSATPEVDSEEEENQTWYKL